MTVKDWKKEQILVIISVFLLFSINLLVFQYTVDIREPWHGELSSGHHQWLSGSTLKFAKNWYRDGPLNLGFTLLENPSSIEFPDILSRQPYVNYLPGCIIPLYVIGELTSTEPNATLLMDYNLLNHFLIAFFLSILIFIFLRQIKIDPVNSFLFATVPLFLELLLPGPLYWHQNVFFADQAVILPFVAYILLEVIQDSYKGRYSRFLGVTQNFILLYGFLTDWLFVFIILTVYIKRILEGKLCFSRENFAHSLKDNLKFWIVPSIVLAFFVIQVYSWGLTGTVLSKVLFRVGISSDGSVTVTNGLISFYQYVTSEYGEIGFYALCFSLITLVVLLLYVLRERFIAQNTDFRIKKIAALMVMLFLPCILQLILFKNHTLLHDFSVLKLSVPLTTIPFVLAPISWYLLVKTHIIENHLKIPLTFKGRLLEKMKVNKLLKPDLTLLVIFLVVTASASFYLANEHPHYPELFPSGNPDYEVLGTSIQKNTQYSDLVFSPNFEIPINPPQQLSYSMKRVYKIRSLDEIGSYTQGLS
ncbi:hypothetical protein, partial [Methanobacterium formicicum]